MSGASLPDGLLVGHEDFGDHGRYVLHEAESAGGGATPMVTLDYRRTDAVVDCYSTVTDPAHRGKGLAAVLVGHVLAGIDAEGGRVVPSCWYVDHYLDQHPDLAHLRA